MERKAVQDEAIKENEERLVALRFAMRQLSRKHELDIQERKEAIVRRQQVQKTRGRRTILLPHSHRFALPVRRLALCSPSLEGALSPTLARHASRRRR